MRKALALELGQGGKGVAGARRASAAALGAAVAAPFPRLAGGDEADLGHQPRERVGVEPEAGDERVVDRVVAAMRLARDGRGSRAGRRGRPAASRAEAAEGERGAARIGAAVERRRAGSGRRGIGWPARIASSAARQRLRAGLEQRRDEQTSSAPSRTRRR